MLYILCLMECKTSSKYHCRAINIVGNDFDCKTSTPALSQWYLAVPLWEHACTNVLGRVNGTNGENWCLFIHVCIERAACLCTGVSLHLCMGTTACRYHCVCVWRHGSISESVYGDMCISVWEYVCFSAWEYICLCIKIIHVCVQVQTRAIVCFTYFCEDTGKFLIRWGGSSWSGMLASYTTFLCITLPHRLWPIRCLPGNVL